MKTRPHDIDELLAHANDAESRSVGDREFGSMVYAIMFAIPCAAILGIVLAVHFNFF